MADAPKDPTQGTLSSAEATPEIPKSTCPVPSAHSQTGPLVQQRIPDEIGDAKLNEIAPKLLPAEHPKPDAKVGVCFCTETVGGLENQLAFCTDLNKHCTHRCGHTVLLRGKRGEVWSTFHIWDL